MKSSNQLNSALDFSRISRFSDRIKKGGKNLAEEKKKDDLYNSENIEDYEKWMKEHFEILQVTKDNNNNS